MRFCLIVLFTFYVVTWLQKRKENKMIIRLEMFFDDEDGYSQDDYPDLTPEQIVTIMKEDFVDTIRKQWNDEEILEALEVVKETEDN